MRDERSMTREIYDWRRLPTPTEGFRSGHRSAVTYDIETLIDHLKSSVDALLSGWAEGRAWDHFAILESRIEDVERAKQVLHDIQLDASARARYATYLDATESMLRRRGPTLLSA